MAICDGMFYKIGMWHLLGIFAKLNNVGLALRLPEETVPYMINASKMGGKLPPHYRVKVVRNGEKCNGRFLSSYRNKFRTKLGYME